MRIILTLLIVACIVPLYPQTDPASLAFKKNRPRQPRIIVDITDDDYQLQERFNLVRKANSGSPGAMHELGLRYLTGEGYGKDTTAAFFWIEKAAAAGHITANYNLGIFYLQGIGGRWNPFLAYEKFEFAAARKMAQAQYVLGVLHTENLVVRRDLVKAKQYFQKAADGGNESAIEALPSMDKMIAAEKEMPRQRVNDSPLMFLDFASPVASREVNDSLLIDDYLKQYDTLQVPLQKLFNRMALSQDELTIFDSLNIQVSAGCPEAMILLGRCFQLGLGVPVDKLTAAMMYLRAFRLDSPRSPELLNEILTDVAFREKLYAEARRMNPIATFIVASLNAYGVAYTLERSQILRYLEHSASNGVIPAMLELAGSTYSGSLASENREKAINLWIAAADSGSIEANVRIVMVSALEHADISHYLPLLREAEQNGSVLAQFLLGYSSEHGIGGKKDSGDAAFWYRRAAARGNRAAFNALKKLYDGLRPLTPAYVIPQ